MGDMTKDVLWLAPLCVGLFIAYLCVGLGIVKLVDVIWFPNDEPRPDGYDTADTYFMGAMVVLWPLVLAIALPIAVVYLSGRAAGKVAP